MTAKHSSQEPQQEWPEPRDWLRRLGGELDARGIGYLEVTSARNKNPGSYSDDGTAIEAQCTLQAAGIVSSITKALCEFPSLRRHPAITALNDLTVALHDLATGGSPALLQKGERSPNALTGHDIIIAYAVLAVRLLKEGCGYSDKKARVAVAAAFAANGIRGRKRAPLTAATLPDWQSTYDEFPEDHAAREATTRHWQEWTARADWPDGVSEESALRYINALASSAIFLNKANNPPPR